MRLTFLVFFDAVLRAIETDYAQLIVSMTARNLKSGGIYAKGTDAGTG
jgi:hypothetical protein